MKFLKNDFPLILILAFICGILISPFFGDVPVKPILMALAALSIAALLSYKSKTANRIIIVLLISLLSVIYYKARVKEVIDDTHILNYTDNKLRIISGVVVRPVVLRYGGGKEFILKLESILIDGEEKAVSGMLLLRTKNVSKKIGYGDRIKFRGRMKKPRNFANPGAFDYERYLKRKGITVTSNVYKDDRIISVSTGYKKGAFYHLMKLKERTSDFIYENGYSENRAIVSALLFGGTKQINSYAHNLFVRTGTAHILAISGLHMGVIAFFFYHITIFILKRSERLALKYNIIKLSYIITIIFLVLYSFLVGMRVSSVRAVIMIGVYILSVLFDRAQNTLRTMIIAAFLILFVYPSSLYDVSFLLSFTAVFAILYLYPKLNLRFEKYFERKSDNYFKNRITLFSLVKNIILVFTLSFVINLLVLPILLYNFNYVSLFAPLLNAIIIPIYSILIIPVNFLIFVFSLIIPGFAVTLLHLNEYIIHLTFLMLKFLDKHVNFPLYTVTPAYLEIFFYYCFIFSLFKIREKGYKTATIIFFSLLLLTKAYYDNSYRMSNGTEINFIDVSHGESILINFVNGERMLIDGGGFYKTSGFDIGRDVVAKFLWKKRISGIDYIVSTHPHPDHLSGLFFIAENFALKKIFIARQDYKNKMYERFLKTFEDKIEFLNNGNDKLNIGSSVITFYNYDYNGLLRKKEEVNRSSVVVMLEHEKYRVLFTSDIDSVVEDGLIKSGIDLRSDVLKISHHGSRDSTSKRFLKAVSPEYAVISVGADSYIKLPSDTVINLLNEENIKVYRTDEDGMITLTFEGDKLKFDKSIKQ